MHQLKKDMTKTRNGLENGLINGLERLPSRSDYTGEVAIILSFKCMAPLIDRKSLMQTSTLPLLQPQSRIKGDVIIPGISPHISLHACLSLWPTWTTTNTHFEMLR